MIGVGLGLSVGAQRSAAAAALSYAEEVLADSPLVYWRLDEASGVSAADASGNGRDGTYVGAPALGAGSLVADGGSAVDLDQTGNQKISRAYESAFDVVEGSMEVWAQPGVAPDGAYYFLGWRNALQIRYDASAANVLDAIVATVAHGLQNVVGGTPTVIPLGTAFHAVLTFDGQVARLYLNGELEAESDFGSASPLQLGAHPLVAGGYSADALSFDGVLDEFAFYDHALSPERILAHYNAGIGA